MCIVPAHILMLCPKKTITVANHGLRIVGPLAWHRFLPPYPRQCTKNLKLTLSNRSMNGLDCFITAAASPWANIDERVDNIGKDYALSLKSNPAYIAAGVNEPEIRNQIEKAVSVCKHNGSPLEIILKDVSTISSRPESMDR